MGEAVSLNPPISLSLPLFTSTNPSLKPPFISLIKASSSSSSQTHFFALRTNPLQARHSLSRVQSLNPSQPLGYHGFFRFPFHGKFGFSAGVGNGEGETSKVVDEAEPDRGESTMPSRFRDMIKEAPEPPVRWPWLIALTFGIYAWRSVLWELSNWMSIVSPVVNFFVDILKLALALVLQFIWSPVPSLIRGIETALYTIRSIYSSIVASTPVSELSWIIILTSSVIAVAEATVPDSASSQPYLLTLAGIIGFASVMDFIPELLFWFLLVGLYCFSKFYKKRDDVSSALPVAAVLAAVGQPWLRLIVMISYVALAISQHCKEPSSNVDNLGRDPPVPLPLMAAALAIGVHVGAKWLRYRHLTWMIA